LKDGWLSVPQQAYLVRQVVPHVDCRIRRDRLVCRPILQPTELSCAYTVQIAYRHGDRPITHVRNPALRPRPDTSGLPHVYTGDELCLYLPGEWNPSMPIAYTILPWASEWLFHYELWLATGDWSGGGHEPPTDQ
jgi:hypothetical protein